ncbi:MAG: hypothetical protein ACE5D6_05880 [Candidatus Zixiibacteriota bacterium]
MLIKGYISFSSGLLLTLLVLTHCGERPNDPNEGKSLMGSWHWVKSCGGLNGNCITPDSVGYDKLVIISQDSIYSEYHDDSLIIQKKFTVEKREWIVNHTMMDALLIDSWYTDMIIIFYSNDTLTLNENCSDCFDHTYVKLGPI